MEYRLCPKQRSEWPDKFLEVLPATINPNRDHLWTYQTREGMERTQSIIMQFGAPEKEPEIIGVGPRDSISSDEIMKQLLMIITIKE